MSFAKGRSANPDGRKAEAEVKRAARAQGARCIEVLAAVAALDAATPEVRAQAAMKLLDLARWNSPARPSVGVAA